MKVTGDELESLELLYPPYEDTWNAVEDDTVDWDGLFNNDSSAESLISGSSQRAPSLLGQITSIPTGGLSGARIVRHDDSSTTRPTSPRRDTGVDSLAPPIQQPDVEADESALTRGSTLDDTPNDNCGRAGSSNSLGMSYHHRAPLSAEASRENDIRRPSRVAAGGDMLNVRKSFFQRISRDVGFEVTDPCVFVLQLLSGLALIDA